jgi:hypothetical protein
MFAYVRKLTAEAILKLQVAQSAGNVVIAAQQAFAQILRQTQGMNVEIRYAASIRTNLAIAHAHERRNSLCSKYSNKSCDRARA